MGLPKLQITRGRRRQPAQANNILQHDPIVSITLTSACIKHLPPTDRTNTLVIAPYTTKLSATDALSGIDSHPILELYQHIQPQSGDKSSTHRWGRQTTCTYPGMQHGKNCEYHVDADTHNTYDTKLRCPLYTTTVQSQATAVRPRLVSRSFGLTGLIYNTHLHGKLRPLPILDLTYDSLAVYQQVVFTALTGVGLMRMTLRKLRHTQEYFLLCCKQRLSSRTQQPTIEKFGFDAKEHSLTETSTATTLLGAFPPTK